MSARVRALLIPLVLLLVTLALLVLPPLLPGHTRVPLWPIDPASPIASRIDRVWTIVTYIGAGVFVLVGGLMWYAFVRFRQPGPITDDEPAQIHGNVRLEVTWTLIPVLIVAVLFAIAVATLRIDAPARALNPQQTPGLVQVDVRGYQWGWAYTSPQLPGLRVGSGDLHLPVDHMIEVRVTSLDVVHDWWVPALDGHLDAYPGHVERSWYMLRTAGQKYYAECSKFCGLLHWQMHNYVVADTPVAFARWALAKGAKRADLARLLKMTSSGLAAALERRQG